MADTKISALSAATTPLTGTEVLPIVQSGATVKVANNDLRPKQIQSNATSGVLQIAGPAAAATRVMTTPDANFTVARTDAAQSFTGNQTLSTGNLVIETSGQGIDFSATPSTGTSELFADYEEGTWTPGLLFDGSMVGSFTYTTQVGTYTKVGRLVTASFNLVWTARPSGGSIMVLNLPFTAVNAKNVRGFISDQGGITNTGTYAITGGDGLVISNYVSTQCSICTVKSGAGFADPLQQTALTSASGQLFGEIIFEVS